MYTFWNHTLHISAGYGSYIRIIINSLNFSQITEFAPYGSLEENFVKKNKNVMKVLTLCKFACQVAHGMHYLASQQLVHRDLATRNILLYQEDLVIIKCFKSLKGE